MPAEVYGERYRFLPRADLLTFEEITRLVGLFVSLGVKKVRVTGGEPLVRDGIDVLVKMLSGLGSIEDLTLTTNGFLLAALAGSLKDAGLRRITISMDSLDPDTFAAMNGRGFGPDRVLEGITAASTAGLHPIKINTVIKRGVNDQGVVAMARHFQGSGHIVRFIEYMDVGNLNGWRRDHVVPSAELVERIHEQLPIRPIGPNYEGEVAERYAYEDGSGEIGFISSVSQPFCGDCTRVRLSPEGEIVTCLFATKGRDIKSVIRAGANDEELVNFLMGTWSARTDRYSELRSSTIRPNQRKIEMYHLGG